MALGKHQGCKELAQGREPLPARDPGLAHLFVVEQRLECVFAVVLLDRVFLVCFVLVLKSTRECCYYRGQD